jgi:hypothetical protein
MVQNPDNKWIHFGQIPFDDYTKHGDDDRRKRFRDRNSKWANAKKYSPAWLSYHLLW